MKLEKRLDDPVLDQMIKDWVKINPAGEVWAEPAKVNLPRDLGAKIERMMSEKYEFDQKNIRYLVIYTSDGKIFSGTLVGETGDYSFPRNLYRTD